MELKGKIAIVTGASSGIGEALAQELTKRGAKVVLAARSYEKIEALAKSLPGSLAVVADMTKASDIKNLVEKTVQHFGRIDILVNNAGQGYDAQVEAIDPAIFRQIFELDLMGPILAMQAVIPTMREEGGGHIVNVSSGTALMFLPNMGGYSSLKRALVGISLTARAELANDHIEVSVVYPYITSTNFEKNTISKGKREWSGGGTLRPADPPEYVAKIICDGIEKNEVEIFAHPWLK